MVFPAIADREIATALDDITFTINSSAPDNFQVIFNLVMEFQEDWAGDLITMEMLAPYG